MCPQQGLREKKRNGSHHVSVNRGGGFRERSGREREDYVPEGKEGSDGINRKDNYV